MHCWVEYGDLTEYNMSIMMHLKKKNLNGGNENEVLLST